MNSLTGMELPLIFAIQLSPMRKIILLIIFSCTLTGLFAQNTEGSLVKWMSLKEAIEASKKQPKPIVMDFYTDWCGWCKRMMATTYADPNLSSYINQFFYPVKFDAEGKDTVEFEGKTYVPTSMAPRTSHPLAIQLLGGKMMYPTTLFMNGFDSTRNEFPIKILAPGYMEKDKIEPVLVFVLENVFRTTGLEDFTRNFNTAFYDSTTQKRIDAMKWKLPEQVFDGNFSEKKKRIVFLHTSWCNSCRVMERGVFPDTALAALRDKFVLVDFNPETEKPLFWNGKLYQKTAGNQFPFHPLVLDLTKGNFMLPSVVILDEEDKIIDFIPFFLNDKLLAEIMTFYGNDIYKTQSWQQWKEGK